MNINEIKKIIFNALEAINLERAEMKRIEITEQTSLFGDKGMLDSLELVSLIVDVETEITVLSGVQISLTDDRAMNQIEYPFGNVSLLSNYIEKLLLED